MIQKRTGILNNWTLNNTIGPYVTIVSIVVKRIFTNTKSESTSNSNTLQYKQFHLQTRDHSRTQGTSRVLRMEIVWKKRRQSSRQKPGLNWGNDLRYKLWNYLQCLPEITSQIRLMWYQHPICFTRPLFSILTQVMQQSDIRSGCGGILFLFFFLFSKRLLCTFCHQANADPWEFLSLLDLLQLGQMRRKE